MHNEMNMKEKRAKLIMKAVSLSLCFMFLAAQQTPLRADNMRNIEAKGEFEICVSPDAMPLSSLDVEHENKPLGIQIDIGKELARRMKVSLKTSWISMRYHAKYTECDAFLGVGRLKGEIENPYLKKTIPYFKVELLLATRPGTDLKNIEDFKTKRVAVDNGSLIHDSLRKKSEAEIFVSYLTDEKRLKALGNNEVDVAQVTNLGLGWFLKNNPGFKVHTTSSKIIAKVFEYDYAFGLRRADRMTVRDFNDYITAMIEDGTLEKIFANYGIQYEVNKFEGEFVR